ncbi:DNA repair protein rad52 [Pseudogymnoascus australis]
MPAPGDQHASNGGNNTANPFEEVKPHISEYTAQEIASLQSRLQKQLGPEYISSRSGPGGQKLHYIAADKCIQLANEVFGFNGWSSQIKDLQVDFVDENPATFKVSLGLSAIVRVSLRDGTFHEDIGYGHIENCKGKAAAFEKAKKEATTDAMKRALRNFGNVLGNCIYDKEYLAKVTKVKVAPTKWEVDNLYRHGAYAKKEEEAAPEGQIVKQEDSIPSVTARGSFEDEFDDGAFDETDFTSAYDPDSHPDEIALPDREPYNLHITVLHQTRLDSLKPDRSRCKHHPGRNPKTTLKWLVHVPPNHAHNTHHSPKRQMGYQGPIRPPGAAYLNHQTPNQPASPKAPFQATDEFSTNQTGNEHHPLHQTAPHQPASPDPKTPTPTPPTTRPSHPPTATPIGFFSAKAALSADGQPPDAAIVLPKTAVFNPHSESPSIRKTPGIDHTKTIPVNRNFKQAPAPPAAVGAAAPVQRGNINVVNPQLDATRRVGAPGSPSPLGNRGSYKPPTMVGKRASDAGGGEGTQRVPLGEAPTNGGVNGGGQGHHEVKRQRMSGP